MVEATLAWSAAPVSEDGDRGAAAEEGLPAGLTSGAGLPVVDGGVSRAACQRISKALAAAA
jgi:hypothetical protein